MTYDSTRTSILVPPTCKEIPITKVLKCSDVTPGCNFEIRGESEDEVLKKADEHAKTAHNMENMTPDVLSKVRSAIHDEGGTATKKVGA